MSNKKYTLQEFSQALGHIADEMRGSILARSALAGGYVIEGYAKINVAEKFTNISSNLANGIQTILVKTSSNRAEVEVGPTAIYGRIQELGGVVKPLTAKMLHWIDESGKHHVAFSVTLPARPYLEPAANEHVQEINEAIAENVRLEIEALI